MLEAVRGRIFGHGSFDWAMACECSAMNSVHKTHLAIHCHILSGCWREALVAELISPPTLIVD